MKKVELQEEFIKGYIMFDPVMNDNYDDTYNIRVYKTFKDYMYIGPLLRVNQCLRRVTFPKSSISEENQYSYVVKFMNLCIDPEIILATDFPAYAAKLYTEPLPDDMVEMNIDKEIDRVYAFTTNKKDAITAFNDDIPDIGISDTDLHYGINLKIRLYKYCQDAIKYIVESIGPREKFNVYRIGVDPDNVIDIDDVSYLIDLSSKKDLDLTVDKKIYVADDNNGYQELVTYNNINKVN